MDNSQEVTRRRSCADSNNISIPNTTATSPSNNNIAEYIPTVVENKVKNNNNLTSNTITNKASNSADNKSVKNSVKRGKSKISSFLPGINHDKKERERKILETMKRKKKMKSSFMALYVGFLTAIGGFLYGYDTGIINGVLEMDFVKKRLSKNKIYFKSNEKAILTGILSLGTIFGSLLAPFISDRYGRKFCLFWSLITFFTIGIILQVSYPSAGLFLAGRLINGIAVGVLSSVIPLFQAEISPRWIRGSVISFYQWAITWGLLVSSAICQGTRNMNDARCFRIPIALQFVWCTILVIGLSLLPESPRFYVMHDDIDGAILSLSRLRCLNIDDKELVEELIEIKASHDYEVSETVNSYLDCFRSTPCRDHQLTRMLTSICLQTIQQCSGINFIFYYGVNFFVATGVSESYLMSFITYAVNVVFTIPGILFVDKIGRRKLLIFGCIGMIISNYLIAIVGIYTDSVIANKIMLAFVCVFIACFASTWGPVVWVVTGELFNLSIRQKAVSLSASTNWIVNFVFAYSTPYLIDEGTHTAAAMGTKIFFLWGSFNVAGLFLTIFFVYETKNLMLEEVDELYRTCPNALKSEKYNKKIQKLSKMNQIENDKQISHNGDKSNNSKNNNTSNKLSSDLDKNIEDNKMMDSLSNNIQEYYTNDTTSLTPMEHLRRWEQNHQHDNILSDNIITRQSVLPFSDSDEDYDLSSEGSENQQNENFNFDYGLYGNNPNIIIGQDDGRNDHGGDIEMGEYDRNQNHLDNIDSNNQQENSDYLQNLREIIRDVNEHTGININLHGEDDQNTNNNNEH